MDMLNLWDDDPEEILLDLGFGCEEPDLSGRIPARFINYPSQAKGINLQVFLEAQKSRIDLENPDVSNRFRQIEVLQHVTTAFSTLMASSTPAEARERRKRMGALLRRVSKKSQLQMQNNQDAPAPGAGPEPADQKVPLKRAKSVLQDTVAMTPLMEEQVVSPQPAVVAFALSEGAPMVGPLRGVKEAPPVTGNSSAPRKRSPSQPKESFEMEEIYSFDENSVTAGSAGGAETSVGGVVRTNSSQSDSSGFLEEPMVPASNQYPSPAPDLIKALSGLSGGSVDSQSSDRAASPSPGAAAHTQSQQSLGASQEKSISPAVSLPPSSPTAAGPSSQSRTHPSPLLSQGGLPGSTRPSSSGKDTSTSGQMSNPPKSPAPDGRSRLWELAANSSEPSLVEVGMDGPPGRSLETEPRSGRVERRGAQDPGRAPQSHARSSPGFRQISPSASGKAQVPSNLRDELLAASARSAEGGASGKCGWTAGGQDAPHASSLIEIQTLDQVFETSVDGSDWEFGDVDAFFRQLDSEGRVYWAEPIAVSSLSTAVSESGSFEACDGNPADGVWTGGPPPPHVPSNSGKPASSASGDRAVAEERAAPSPQRTSLDRRRTSPGSEPPSRSVSVQMSKSPSSHIVHRKDVPYAGQSGRSRAGALPPLDTSTPFRAVQSWTDLNIQRSALARNSPPSAAALYVLPNAMAVSASALDAAPGRPLLFSSSSSFHVLSKEWRSHDCLSGRSPADEGPWPRRDPAHARAYADADHDKQLWRRTEMAAWDGSALCERSCDCCAHKSQGAQQPHANMAFSLHELEEMMLCLQQFCAVLSNMEEQLSEDQAAVYTGLSEHDRETLRDIAELRRAVKEEAGELETQLNELAHDYDDSLKTKMRRLLDEQFLLCSQLRGSAPGRGSAPQRSVATQCCLPPAQEGRSLPRPSWAGWDAGSHREAPAGSEKLTSALSCPPSKADKMDILGFLQRLKESLRPAVSSDTLD